MAGRFLAAFSAKGNLMPAESGLYATPLDLHLHTRFSDGDEEPAVLARRCLAAGLRVAAVTDHNTMAGSADFAQAVGSAVTAIPGCEITADWQGEETHCLAYFIDPHDRLFQTRIGEVHNNELAWWRAWTDRAQDAGIPLTWDRVSQRIGGGRVAYVGDYLASLLEAAGDDPRFATYTTANYGEIISQWCRPGKPLYVEHPRYPSIFEVLTWIADAGGVAVLAHAGRRLTSRPSPDLEALLAPLCASGLTGLEVWTSWHTLAESDRLAEACARFGLIATLGSDYHGTRVKPWALGPGLVPVPPVDPLGILDALADRCPTRTTPKAAP